MYWTKWKIHYMIESQMLKNENFTNVPYYVMVEESKYQNFVKELNEEQKLIFDDIMFFKNVPWFINTCVYFL